MSVFSPLANTVISALSVVDSCAVNLWTLLSLSSSCPCSMALRYVTRTHCVVLRSELCCKFRRICELRTVGKNRVSD